jgi:hypothetical protein
MRAYLPSRLSLGAALCLLLAGGPAFARGLLQGPRAQAIRQQRAAQRSETRAQNNAARPSAKTAPNSAIRPAAHAGNLAQWMDSHKKLSLADQQRALENEPGFRELPAETQQRYRDRLVQLSNMNPQQRARILDRNEALERLTPVQRQQWDGAVQQLHSLPQPRKALIARSILDLREMPPDQRDRVIDAPAFGAQFSPDERGLIRTLLTAEPYAGER